MTELRETCLSRVIPFGCIVRRMKGLGPMKLNTLGESSVYDTIYKQRQGI